MLIARERLKGPRKKTGEEKTRIEQKTHTCQEEKGRGEAGRGREGKKEPGKEKGVKGKRQRSCHVARLKRESRANMN